MKKALTITGRVELTREEISKAIIKFLRESENLEVEKVIYEVKSTTELSGAVVYVHQSHQQDEVPKFDLKVKKQRVDPPKGFSRPNHGIGPLLGDVLNSGKAFTLNELMEEVKHDFPKLTCTLLAAYVSRTKMVGYQVKRIKKGSLTLYQKLEAHLNEVTA